MYKSMETLSCYNIQSFYETVVNTNKFGSYYEHFCQVSALSPI